jgi:hypothetical protein
VPYQSFSQEDASGRKLRSVAVAAANRAAILPGSGAPSIAALLALPRPSPVSFSLPYIRWIIYLFRLSCHRRRRARLPEHVFAFINYLTNFMFKFEKYNFVKLDDYKLAKNGNTGFADYVGAALQKTILIYGYNGCNRGRQDFDRCMLEDFHEVGDIGV